MITWTNFSLTQSTKIRLYAGVKATRAVVYVIPAGNWCSENELYLFTSNLSFGLNV